MTHGSNVLVLGKDTFRNTPEVRFRYLRSALYLTKMCSLIVFVVGRYLSRHGVVRRLRLTNCEYQLILIEITQTYRAMNPVVRSDIVVSHFLDSVGGYRNKERRDKLLDILDVDLDW